MAVNDREKGLRVSISCDPIRFVLHNHNGNEIGGTWSKKFRDL